MDIDMCVCIYIFSRFISPRHSPRFVLTLPVLYRKYFLIFPPSLFSCAALCQNEHKQSNQKEKNQKNKLTF